MSCINADTRSAWQAMADEASKTRPHPGRRVRIIGGRKHKGKVGTVVRHQVSQYGNAYRYGNDASHHLRDMRGRYGWTCLVRTDLGEQFWVDADHTECDPPEMECES